MIHWTLRPSGHCPVQAEGTFLGYYFYFRSRGNKAFIEFCFSEQDWEVDHVYQFYHLWTTKHPKAGWLPHWFCTALVHWGCLRFLLKRNKPKMT